MPPLPAKKPILPPLPKLPRIPRPSEEGPALAPVEPMRRKPTHVFVRLDKYNAILKAIGNMESKINELRNTITKINSIKEQEDKIVKSWEALLHEAKAKVEDVSKKLPEVERA